MFDHFVFLALTDNERLFEHVLGDYNKNVEPFEAPDSKLEVEFGVTPLYLDLDQHGILKVGNFSSLKYKLNHDYLYPKESM